jgi:EAL domain-containing protein (putative c-di-GMP-specific phosphodiesterase class I)
MVTQSHHPPGEPARIWYLEGATDEQGQIQRISIVHSPFVIGRGDDATLSVDFRDMSKRHAEFTFRDNVLYVRDLGSKNGTFLNGQPVRDAVPLRSGDILTFGKREFRVVCESIETLEELLARVEPAKRTSALLQLGSRQVRELLASGAAEPRYHPVVDLADGSVVAYDVFGRGSTMGGGLISAPSDLFFVAAYLGLEEGLSHLFRLKGVEYAHRLPGSALLFLRIHPAELDNPDRLAHSASDLRNQHPDIPVAFEINQASVVDLGVMQKVVAMLEPLAIGLVLEGFRGPAQRLDELARLRPDFIKFDKRLTHRIKQLDAQDQDTIGLLVSMAGESGIRCIADWIAHGDDMEVCRQLGFHAAQGPYFGLPSAAPSL